MHQQPTGPVGDRDEDRAVTQPSGPHLPATDGADDPIELVDHVDEFGCNRSICLSVADPDMMASDRRAPNEPNRRSRKVGS